MQEQAKIREKYEAVIKLFDAEEALVIRMGNDFIIRLIGLSFPVGKSTIEPKYSEFLNKVYQAINLFADTRIIINGHTDSFGSDATNLALSKDRAEAVKFFLVKNFGVVADKLQTIGYGEGRPIATNEDEEGRAKNRRIEVVIHPELSEANQ